MHRVALVLACCVGATLSSDTEAAPIYFNSATTAHAAAADASNTIVHDSDFGGGNFQPESTSMAIVDSVEPNTATATATARVSDGTLAVYTLAIGNGEVGFQTANADAQATWSDTLLLTSNTLSIGTLVGVELNLLPLFSLSGGACLTPLVETSITGRVELIGGTSGTPFVQVSADECSSVLPVYAATTVMARIGDELVLNATLSGRSIGIGGRTAIVDALHTLYPLVTPLADFGYTSASGFRYDGLDSVSTVPEPTSLILLGTGLVGVGTRRWRQRKQ